MSVKHWTSPNDANHSNRHAEADGIEFFAFPYQNYLGRQGDYLAVVGDFTIVRESDGVSHCVTRWSAVIKLCQPSGATTNVIWQGFDTQDEAFEWAAEQLTKLNVTSM